jgi:hypothetical protein
MSKEEGRRKKEEGRRKREEGRICVHLRSSAFAKKEKTK